MIKDSSKFILSKTIGTIMFELLQKNNIEYSEKTKKNIEYFNFYLDKCIEDSNYCNNKIFLACMQECASLSLPKKENVIENIYTIKQRCDYNIIHSTPVEKTDIIYKNKNNIKYSKIYYCKSIEDLFVCSLYELFEKEYIIRKCMNCNKFFVTKEKGSRRKYCYYYSPQDNKKTCYDYMNQRKSKENRKTNEIIKLYNSITNRLRTRQNRTEDESISELYFNELTFLSQEYERMKKDVKLGKMQKEDLEKYLYNYNEDDKKNWRKKYGGTGTNKK